MEMRFLLSIFFLTVIKKTFLNWTALIDEFTPLLNSVYSPVTVLAFSIAGAAAVLSLSFGIAAVLPGSR